METSEKKPSTRAHAGLWRRLPLVAGLLLAGILLAACQHPTEDTIWGESLQAEPGTIRDLTPEHQRGHPTRMHIDTENQHAYITLSGTTGRPDNRVALVDLQEGRLISHIEVGHRPLDIRPDPQEERNLFVAHAYTPSISVIETETNTVAQVLHAPYYIERLHFTSNGDHLLGSDRANDRLIVWSVTRTPAGYILEENFTVPTGPNPEEIAIIPPHPEADWEHDRLVAVTDRHGGSITLVDLATGQERRIGTNGPPMALSARDGLLFISGVGPGDGTPQEQSGTPETGTADLENSLLVLDLRAGPSILQTDEPVPQLRYLSDTARPDNAPSEHRILAGALPRALYWDEAPLPGVLGPPTTTNHSATLWITYHSTDQMQALYYHAPGPDDPLQADLLTTRNGTHGQRLSHVAPGEPLGPGLLTDTVHGVFETPPGPRQAHRIDDVLVVIAQLPEQLHLLHLADCPGPTEPTAPCTSRTIDLVEEPVPYPSGDYERGERLFISAFPSADQDRSAVMCHTDGLATGGKWALPHRDLHPMKIPRLDQVADSTPWLIDGSVTRPEDYLNATAGDLLLPDENDPHNLATHAQQRTGPQDNENTTLDGTTQENITADHNATMDALYPGALQRLRHMDDEIEDVGAWMRLSWAYLLGERRVPPPPPFISTPEGQSLQRGLSLFNDIKVGCAACHIGGTTGNLLSQEDSQELPRPPNAERMKAPPLTNVWDREATGLLWDNQAPRVQSAILPTGHPCLAAQETGLEEPWHGDATGRTCESIDDLAAYVRALETER